MTNDRVSGLALIAGSASMIITMSLHPTGHDLFAPGQLSPMAHMAVAVHALALMSMPVLFFGALGLSQHLGAGERFSVAALIAYGFAMVAGMNAAVFSGLVAPSLVRSISASDSSAAETWRIAFHYNGALNQGFARVFVVASSVAILLWSSSILRGAALSRGVAIYGCILGPVTVIAVLSGHLRLDVHGFGMVVLGQAVWLIIVGVLLCRARRREFTAVAPQPDALRE
jgi:hypothetical protein